MISGPYSRPEVTRTQGGEVTGPGKVRTRSRLGLLPTMLWPLHTHQGFHAVLIFPFMHPIGSRKLQPCASLDSVVEFQCWSKGSAWGDALRPMEASPDSPSHPQSPADCGAPLLSEELPDFPKCPLHPEAWDAGPGLARKSSCVICMANLVLMSVSSQLGFKHFITWPGSHPLSRLPSLPPELPLHWPRPRLP